MSPGSSKRTQSSPSHRDSGYWFDLPDLTRRRTVRRRWLRLFAVGVSAAAALLMFVLFDGPA
ncbi:hypothetical protein JR065_10595 [Xanthomonas sp. AmX2]|uniref:hypothetical protein n=1 Tax=Xanthomonas sp. TaxID=29446 RepID=UPI00197EB711|nr:hypothetical protein [Xanthomonas sp.]MBN6150791.1 hypothetical protein [Xanthomonas sp.]